MEADYSAWKFWLDLAQALLTLAIGIYVWIANRSRVNASRIRELEDELDGRLDLHDQRLARVEERIKHGPTHDDLKRIHERIDDTANSVNRIAGEFSGLRRTLDLIHEYLLNEGARK